MRIKKKTLKTLSAYFNISVLSKFISYLKLKETFFPVWHVARNEIFILFEMTK